MNSRILIFPVLVPLIAGICIYLYRRPKRFRTLFTFLSVLVNTAIIAYIIIRSFPGGSPTLRLVRLTESIELALKCDGLSIVFLSLIGFLWPLATLYSFEYMDGEHSQERFFAFYTLSYGVTAGVALSANPITMYLFYELLTLVTVPLVAHEEDVRSARAAKKYIVYSIGGATMSFIGIMMLYTYGSYEDFILGGVLHAEEAYESKLLAAYMLTFIGFGVKAAIFPLHGWLPSASVAPTPVTALLHAVAVVKSGVFASIRSTFYSFGPEFLSGTWCQTAAIIISGITVIYGSCMALREQHLKRRLAYSTVSNLSYILLGMAFLTTGGLAAGLSHMLFHGLMKITLFFCAGTVLCKTGREYTPHLEGLGRKMPLTFITFAIASLALTGAPLLPGFISKMNLMGEAAKIAGSSTESLSACAVFGIAALLISALLTAAYLIPLCIRSFIVRSGSDPVFTEKDRDPGWMMLVPFALLCAAMIILGSGSSWLMNILEAIL